MREININLSNLEEQYDCGHCGEAKASELNIDISDMAEADFYVVVFKNSFSQTYCTERFYAEDIKENVIHIALWQDLTKTDKERAVVEAYIEESGKLKMLEKSPVIHLHFDGSISSDKALSEKEPEGLYLSLLKLEGNLKNDMDVLNTIISAADDSVRNANTAADNAKKITDEITSKLNNGELKGEKGDTGAIGPPGATGPPGKDAEPIAVDCKLSAESNNPIANKAVAILFSENKRITELDKTYTGNAAGTSKTTYYGFATRIYTPEKISGVRVYTMVTANAAVTCQLLSSDRTTVYAQTVQNVPQSDVPSFVDFMFDDVPDIAEDNIYVAVRSDVKCITQAMTIGSKVNTELVTADNMDETGMANNCFVSGGNWSPVKSTSNKYSFTLQFGILSAETSYSAKLNREEYNLPKMNYIYVSTNGSDETGDGSELKPYATIWHANESITDNSELNRYTIKAANGTYTDLQERFAGDTSTLGAFQGIRTKNYVYYEGNIRNPSACVIEWDGAAGFDLETYTNDQAVDKCPFHIVGSYAEGAMHTSVRGFKIVGKNLRYALHCETAGHGVNVDYEAGDMILEWYGRPDVTDNNNEIPAIGTGSSPFERAYFHDINIQCNSVKPNGEAYKFGFQNHDNANKYNVSPAVITGAHYRFENMNFNGSKFQLRSLTDHPSETFDVCEMKNCVGITTAQKLYASVAEKCNWQADVKMCDIADNQL